MKNKAIGSTFDDFLVEEGISEEVEAGAVKKMNVYESIMQGLTEAVDYQQGKTKARRTSLTIKPVESTVIKDKKIVREVIAQVCCKPTAEDKKRAKARRKLFKELTTKDKNCD